MKPSTISRLLLWIGIYCLPLSVFAQTDPHIILILADDMGYGDATTYNDESKIPTPNIDKLASQGMKFMDAHSPSSVCTPTRYGILTGRYAWRTDLKKSVLWPWDPPLIETERLTLPEMLKQKSYKTACIGKWHLGWNWLDQQGNPLNGEVPIGKYDREKRLELGKKVDFSRQIQGGPLAHGFDYYFGDDVPNFPPYAFIENDHTIGIPSVDKPEDMFGNPGPALPAWDLSMVMPRLAQESVQYIEKYEPDSDTPFFLYLPLTAPHTPIAPSPHFIGKSKAGWYGDYVVQVDAFVGEIMAALERKGIADNALLIFTSDNGSPQRDGSNMNGEPSTVKAFGHDPSRPWRGMKGDIWEGGHRVPFIVRWPGKIAANSQSNEPIILLDLMRSLADIVHIDLPEQSAEDSYNISPVLLGKKREQPIRSHLVHHSNKGIFAIRKGPWKLILGKESGGFTQYKAPENAPKGQLYHLIDDPGEQKNLYSDYPHTVKELEALLNEIKEKNRSFIGD